jgi:hypothetical protein
MAISGHRCAWRLLAAATRGSPPLMTSRAFNQHLDRRRRSGRWRITKTSPLLRSAGHRPTAKAITKRSLRDLARAGADAGQDQATPWAGPA